MWSLIAWSQIETPDASSFNGEIPKYPAQVMHAPSAHARMGAVRHLHRFFLFPEFPVFELMLIFPSDGVRLQPLAASS